MELDPSSPLARDTQPADTVLDLMENGKEMKMDRGSEEDEEEVETAGISGRLTSSRMGNVSAIESSQMFVSLLTEGSSIRYDSSMQVCLGSLFFSVDILWY